MADQVNKTAQEGVDEAVLLVPDVPQAAEKAAAEVVVKEPPPLPESDEEPVKPKLQGDEGLLETKISKPNADAGQEKVPESGSYIEESTRVADLPECEKKALEQLKQLVQEALNKHDFGGGVVKKQLQSESAAQEDDKTVEEKEPAAKEESKDEVVTDEPPKAETKVVAESKTNEPAAKEENIAVLETENIEEKVTPAAAVTAASDTGEDDGAKTVEAIEETIVSVSSSVQPEAQTAAKETAQGKLDVVSEGQNELRPEEISIWGIPLLADERSDVILLKFLRARDFKVKDAFTMLKNTIRWRKEFGIDELIEQDLGDNDLEKVVFMHGFDKDGHPVCYNVYGEFQNKELYQKTFSDEEKRQNFLRWRIQFLEKGIRKLDFSPGGISTIVQVNDLKNSPGLSKWELRQATKQALQLLQDNYPEFVARQVFINVPWWYLAVNRMISPFLTQRTRSKFVFAGPSKSAECLFRYIAAEQVPVKYGGLSKEGEFTNTDAVTEITVKPSAKHTVEIPVTESCLVTWEVRVVGWEVRYGAEFVPSAEESYTVIIHKARKVASTETPVLSNNFKIGEPGKVVLTIQNPTSKKKKLLYRLKTKPASD